MNPLFENALSSKRIEAFFEIQDAFNQTLQLVERTALLIKQLNKEFQFISGTGKIIGQPMYYFSHVHHFWISVDDAQYGEPFIISIGSKDKLDNQAELTFHYFPAPWIFLSKEELTVELEKYRFKHLN